MIFVSVSDFLLFDYIFFYRLLLFSLLMWLFPSHIINRHAPLKFFMAQSNWCKYVICKYFRYKLYFTKKKITKSLNRAHWILRRTYSHILFACLYICSTVFFLYFIPVVFLSDAPICSTTHEELLGALKHETLTLKCEVDASPPADSFHWTFNSSGESTDLPARLHSSEVHFSLLIS